MKNLSVLIMAIVLSFCLGFSFHSFLTKAPKINLKRVTGVGGIFFKCHDPKMMRKWYKDHLGFVTNPYGTVFSWYTGADSTRHGYTQWAPFRDSTNYFEPSPKDFMINYRVADLRQLVDSLKAEGVTITDTISSYNYGKFIHIMDPEQNKIELWEPNDIEYGKFPGGTTK